MACLCSINTFYNIFISYEFFKFHLEYFQLLKYQNMLHFQHSHIHTAIEFVLIDSCHQDLLYMFHPLL